jgi:hypothetical protein
MIKLARITFSLFFIFSIFSQSLKAENLSQPIQVEELANAVLSSIEKIDELRELKNRAKKLGIKVSIGGDSAVHIVNYARKHLQSGAENSSEFNSDYYSIFDKKIPLEIVVDKETKESKQLVKYIVEKFPHLNSGPKVTVKKYANDKLDKNDIYSNAVLPLTPKLNKIEEFKKAPFLKSISSGQLYVSLASANVQNPSEESIRSILKNLDTAFSLQLKISDEDKAKMADMIHNAKKNHIFSNSKVKGWLKEYGNSTLIRSTDKSYSYSILSDIGMLKIFKDVGSEWADKIPLYDQPFGIKGRTMAELGSFFERASDQELEKYLPLRATQDSDKMYEEKTKMNIASLRKYATSMKEGIFVHDIKGRDAYRNVTSGPNGKPNVIISQEAQENPNVIGRFEEKRFGFYTLPGRSAESLFEGARVVFKVDPNAREGSDFSVGHWLEGEIIFYNRNALRVVDNQSGQTCTPEDYFRRKWPEEVPDIYLNQIAKEECKDMTIRKLLAYESEWKKIEKIVAALDPEKTEEWLRMSGPGYKPDLSVLMRFCDLEGGGLLTNDSIEKCALILHADRLPAMSNGVVESLKKLASFSAQLKSLLNVGCVCTGTFSKFLKGIKKAEEITETIRIFNEFLEESRFSNPLQKNYNCVHEWIESHDSKDFAKSKKSNFNKNYKNENPLCTRNQELELNLTDCNISDILQEQILNSK